MRKFLLNLFIVCFVSFSANAQSFSNQGKDFWVGYGYHQVMVGNNGQDMVLYFATDQLTTVTVSIPGLGYTQTYPNIAANTIFTTPILPKTGATDARLLTSGLSSKGIHIESTSPIVAYAHIYNASVSGACVLLPTNTLGKEYYSINYTNNSNSANANSWFYIVAADTGTTVVEIEPSASTTNGWSAGSSNTITLTQGQVYNVMGSLILNAGCGGGGQPPCTSVDLTGSVIKSVASGSGVCKKIAVFSGSGRISLTCNNTPSSSDNYMVQAFPKAAWGKRFLTATTGGNMTNNIYRVCVSDPAAVVRINGVITSLPLIGNFYYQIPITSIPQKIESNLPITVAQYISSQGACSNGNPGDPEVIYLSPVEQSISNVLFNSNLLVAGSPSHFANVIIPNGGTALSSFKRDGINIPPASFTVHPQDPAYSFIKISGLALGGHRLESDSGFNAIAYGFAAAESYGYNAGTNVRDFNQQLFTPSQYGIINDGSAYSCLNTPFTFNLYLPDSLLSNSGPTSGMNIPIRFDSMRWSVSSPTNFVPNNFPVMVRPSNQIPPGTAQLPYYPNPVVRPDSINIRNGKTVCWYSLPTFYNITTPGNYTITVRGFSTNSTSDGCSSGNETDYVFTLIIPPAPLATFINSQPGCPADPVQFTETNTQTPYSSSTYLFNWNFGDPASGANNTSNVRNPVHTFSGPGSYIVSFSNITTAGCVSATVTNTVIVPQLVNATISGSTEVCINTTSPNINFNIANGVAPYTIRYTLSTNGGAPVVQTPIVTSALTNPIAVPTSATGTFVYNITSIENANPSICIRNITGQTATITVNPLPTATVSGSTNVCQGTTSPNITFTGANATAPYTFTYNINGGVNQIVTTTTGNSVNVAVPTGIIGTFTYQLVSVKDATTTLCATNYPGVPTDPGATVIVQATSTAIIAGSASVCQDAVAPIITFTAANGTAPFTFKYNINGGAIQTLVTTATSNSATVTVPMTSTGTFVYNLLSVENTGPTTCLTPITGASATIVINPNPTATITGSNIVCQNTGSQNITFTGTGGTAPYTFTYNINGGANQTVTTVSGNSVTVPVSSATIGIFTYTLTQVKDASPTTLCTRNYTTANTAVFQVQATSTATIAGNATVCQDATAPIITFNGANGTPPFTFEYNINGGATQTISTLATSNSVTLPVPMAATGTFIYNLLSVKNTGPILCLTPITAAAATVVIRPIPSATIAGSITVCQNSNAPNITFTGANATAPYIFTYTINGGAPINLTSIGNSITVPVATTTPGTYIYALTQVKESSSTQCIKTYTATTATVIVNQLATATIAGTTTACQAGTSPVITFTAVGGVAPFTFNYTLNGAPLSVTTTVGNSVTVPVSTTTPGTFVYNLVSVKESSSQNCVNNQTGTATVIIHPKPTASYALAAPYCAEKAVTFTPTFGITPTGSVTSWVWNYGNGTGTQIRTDGNPFTITYATAGVKPVSFKVISDKSCESDLATIPAVVINSKPVAGFINPEACLADAFAQFTDTSNVVGGTIVFWEWDFGDATPIVSGSTPAQQNPLHAFATVGNKTVKLTVTTNSGCKDTTIQSFFINGEVTSANFISQNGGNFCSNRPVQIKENSVVNVGGLIRVDIYWDNVGAPTVVETDDLPTPGKIYSHSYPNLQTDVTYKVRYIAYSGFNGVCQKEVIKDVVVRAAPVASFMPPINVCLNGGPIQLSGSEIGGVGGTSVYMGTGVSATGLFNPLTAGAGSNNNITYTAISPNNCDSALIRPIHVLVPPVANFTTVGNICVGPTNLVKFRQTSTSTEGGAIVKWIYDFGDGSAVQTFTTGADVTHAYNIAGTYTAHLIVETAFGCRNAAPGKALTFTVNALPIPSYTFTNTACLPNATIVFTNTSANLVANSYNWSFALPSTLAANLSTATSPSHVYTNLGPHNTQLVATNILTGCKDSTLVIPVNTIQPAPVVVFGVVPDICLNNGTVQLTQGSETSGIAGGPGVYSGVGVNASGVFNPLVAGVGTHTLTYTFTSTFNCPASVTRNVKVLAAPVVNTFTTIGNKCEVNQTIFQNTTTSTAGVVANWIYNWGDASALQTATNGNAIPHVYTTANTYMPTLTLVTNYGCKSSPAFPLTVVINPIPRPNFTYSDTACLPVASVLFKNTTPNINDWAYTWSFDVPSTLPADISTQQNNITHLYYTQAPHTVRLIAVSGTTGCTDSIFKPILTIHPAPFANFNFSKPFMCVGDNVNVLDVSTPGDGVNTRWDWSWGDLTTANGQNPAAHIYANAGDFNVKLKITNNWGCVDDTAKVFTVHPFPIVNAGLDSVILQGGNLTLTPTVSGNDLNYLWTGTPAPLNLSSTTIKNPIASPIEDITYKLTVTARGNCSAFDFVFIKVLKAPVIPNTFTPNNDGVHDTWVIQYLESYPDNRVQVFTRTGQLVFESKRYVKPWDGNLNGKSLPIDTYYYIVEPGTGRTPLTGYVTILK